MTTSSIGTASRTYSTLQAWENACPANLVTSTQTWEGECYNDSEFTSTTIVVDINGITTSSTYYVELRCASGQSFRDNASVRSNALDYNASNGVGVRTSGAYYAAINVQINNVRIKDLQIKCDGAGNAAASCISTSADYTNVSNCLLKTARTGIQAPSNGNGVYYNLLCIGSGAYDLIELGRTGAQGTVAINCTVVKTGATGGTAYPLGNYNTRTLINCAGFNCTNFTSGTATDAGSSGYNCTDLATAFGSTGNQVSKTFANQFQSTTNDFRVKAGADLINNGSYNANTDPDISKTTRNATTPTIGAWEYTAAAASFIATRNIFARQAVKRASVY